MNTKRYSDWRKPAIIFLSIYFLIGGIGMSIAFIIGWSTTSESLNVANQAMFAILILLGLSAIPMTVFGFFPLGLCTLEVNQEVITWRCPCQKKVTICPEDCVYVGIATIPQSKHVRTPLIRGDETSYIYLSTRPVDEKTKRKINAKPPKKGLVYFQYRDDLCLHLMEILPEEKTRALAGFYSRMQDADRTCAREEAAKKRKKEKEKEKKRKKK